MHIPALFGGYSRFHPGLLSGLTHAYRADRGATAAQWDDQSGNGNHLTQAAQPTQRPVYSATAYGNHQGLTFDGSNDNMLMPTVAAGAKTIAVAWKMSSVLASGLRTIIRTSDGSSTRCEIAIVNSAGYQSMTFACDFATAGLTARGIPFANDTNVHTAVLSFNGGSNTSSGSYTILGDGNPWNVVASSTLNASAGSVGSIGARSTASGFEIFPTPGVYFRACIHSGAKTHYEMVKLHRWLSYGFTGSPNATPQAIFEGDSLTFGQGATSTATTYPQRVLAALGGAVSWGVWNVAVGGQTLTDMLSDVSTQVVPYRDPRRSKNVVVLLGGTNDLGLSNDTDTQVINRILSYCSIIRAAGTKIVVCTIPARTWSGAEATKEPRRLAVNSYITTNGANFCDGVADLAADARFQDPTNLTYYNADQLHWKDALNQVAADIVTPVLLAA